MNSIASQTVCAVTVAYNDPDELACLLESIARQTRPIDGLIVIDNSEAIAFKDSNKNVFDSSLPEIPCKEYIVMDRNRGSAHGFKKGMEIAHTNGFDWVWLLDQDGCAEEMCLEYLLKTPRKALVLCPKVLSMDDRITELTFRGMIDLWGNFVPILVGTDENERAITAFATHGVMISRIAMEDVGYFDDRNFFCGWEDHDYSFRLKKHNCRMMLVPRSKVYHPNLLVKYIEPGSGKLAFTSRMYILINSVCHFPAFLGTTYNDGTFLGKIRHQTKLVLFKKHIKGIRRWITIVFSILCLTMMKITGRKVPYFDSIKMYMSLKDIEVR
jgi:GT2 family glycosyltransferase